MTRLTLDQISRETKDDAAAAISLALSHRALSDVSCLSNFWNLERLDLSCNCLSSLEDLSSCVNLKWLSVVENKLETLKGVEGLTKLTVLNAGKNMLRTMDGIESVASLRALILNDNKISSICRLDRLRFLNTLVLSRNPIVDIGDSLMKAKSITKLSLSHCQIEKIGSSLTSCVGLKEARFSHNMIICDLFSFAIQPKPLVWCIDATCNTPTIFELRTLPSELAQNIRLQNLDVGSNLIENWLDIKVLSALPNLKNLNLLGNPIAEKEKLAKVKRLVPHLQIFNAKPLERSSKGETTAGAEKSSHSNDDYFLPRTSDNKATYEMNKRKLKLDGNASNKRIQNSDNHHDALPDSKVVEGEKAMGRKKPKSNSKTKTKESTEDNPLKDSSGAANKSKRKKHVDKEDRKFEGIDDVEKPFEELIFSDNVTEQVAGNKKNLEVVADGKLLGGLVLNHGKKRKKTKALSGVLALQLLPAAAEVGMGGPSAWD